MAGDLQPSLALKGTARYAALPNQWIVRPVKHRHAPTKELWEQARKEDQEPDIVQTCSMVTSSFVSKYSYMSWRELT
jgi:hypothetical protein